MSLRPFLVGFALALSSLGRASAQPAPAQPAPSTTEAPIAAEAELRKQYDRGFAALAAGKFPTAIAELDAVALATLDPELRSAARELSRLARRLVEQAVQFERERPEVTAPMELPRLKSALAAEDRPDAGRIEFVAMSTLVGFYSGFVINDVLDVDDFRLATAIVTATTAGSFTGALFGSRGRRITGGMGSAYIYGVVVGGANGLMTGAALDIPTDDYYTTYVLGSLVTGGAAGLLYSHGANPTRGQMTFSMTLASMGFASAGLGMLIFPDLDLTTKQTLWLLTGGLDFGAAAGLALSPRLNWSRSRANLVWLSAFLGAVGGFGAVALIAGEPDSDREGRIFAGATLLGMWGGFTLGTHLTRNMAPADRFDLQAREETQAIVVPTRIGSATGLAIMGAF
jgi:hypothetical protein